MQSSFVDANCTDILFKNVASLNQDTVFAQTAKDYICTLPNPTSEKVAQLVGLNGQHPSQKQFKRWRWKTFF